MRILLVGGSPEDPRIREALAHDHYHLCAVADVEAAIAALSGATIDLVLLDTGAPEATHTLVAALRETSTRLLVMCGDAAPEHRARLLDAGADDCMTTPCAGVELRARVTALLRRAATFCGSRLECGPISLDLSTHGVFVDGEPVTLSATEYRLLRCLLRHAGVVVSRDQLNQEVWGGELERHSNAPDVYVSYLRRRLSGRGSNLIRTIRGAGYLMAPQAPAPDATS